MFSWVSFPLKLVMWSHQEYASPSYICKFGRSFFHVKSTLRAPSFETRANDFELPLKSLENLTENFQTDSWRNKQWNRNSWLEILENLHGYALQGWPLFQYSGNFFSTRHWKGPEIQTGIFGRGKSALSLVHFKYTNLIGSLDVVHLLFNSLLTDYWLMLFRLKKGFGLQSYTAISTKKFTDWFSRCCIFALPQPVDRLLTNDI